MFNKEGYIIPEKKLQQYKSTPAREWQGLSDDELTELMVSKGETSMKYLDFARAIEQALRNKNEY